MSKSRILNFTGGEVAPSFYNAVNLEKFLRSLMTLQNYIIHRSGGALNRLGDEHLDEVKDSNEEVRLIPFTASNKTTYTLELNAGAIRFIKNGQYLRDDEGNPYEVYVGYDKNLNELNYVQSADVMTIVHNSRLIKQLKKIDEFDWRVEGIDAIRKSGPPRENTWGLVGYYSHRFGSSGEDIPSVKNRLEYDMYKDNNYKNKLQGAPRVKTTGVYVNWRSRFELPNDHGVGGLNEDVFVNHDFRYDVPIAKGRDGYPVFDPFNSPNLPTSNSLVSEVTYYIVSLNASLEESEPLILKRRFTRGRGPGVDISNRNNPFYVVFRQSSDKVYGYRIYKKIDNNSFGLIAALNEKQDNLLNLVAGTTIPNYGSGLSANTVQEYKDIVTMVGTRYSKDGLMGSGYVKNYKYALIGYWKFNSIEPFVRDYVFKDTGITPLTQYSPHSLIASFNPQEVKPSATAIYQQRQYYGNGGGEDSEKIWASRGNSIYTNFQVSKVDSLDPSDALDFIIDSNKFNPIRHMTDLDGLIVQTDIGAFKISGGQDGKITPLTINSQKISGYGIQENLAPLEVGKELIFVQNYDSIVRVLDPRREETKDDDLTKFASHLFDGYKIVDWAVQLVPNQNIYAVRDDGKILCLTYAPLDEIRGWSVFDFIDSKVGTCCVTPEQDEDGNNILSLYINKEIMVNGVKKKYTSRIKPRHIKLRDNMHFMDSYKVIKPYPDYLIDVKTGDRSKIDKNGKELMYLNFLKK